jgi:bacteriocin resistance YdeI/OmpD-like protein/uncharacterized protein DUF1905
MQFSAKIFIIGVNPYVFLPVPVLKKIFSDAGKDKGYIPVALIINNKNFIQHLVKYSGKWRLYLNGPMRKAAGKDVGDTITIFITHDPAERITPVHPKLKKALAKNKVAETVFNSLPQSRKKEIARYINALKTEESIDKNVTRAINFLLGNERFIGRDKP